LLLNQLETIFKLNEMTQKYRVRGERNSEEEEEEREVEEVWVWGLEAFRKAESNWQTTNSKAIPKSSTHTLSI